MSEYRDEWKEKPDDEEVDRVARELCNEWQIAHAVEQLPWRQRSTEDQHAFRMLAHRILRDPSPVLLGVKLGLEAAANKLLEVWNDGKGWSMGLDDLRDIDPAAVLRKEG